MSGPAGQLSDLMVEAGERENVLSYIARLVHDDDFLNVFNLFVILNEIDSLKYKYKPHIISLLFERFRKKTSCRLIMYILIINYSSLAACKHKL